jgi:hypothetical protein
MLFINSTKKTMSWRATSVSIQKDSVSVSYRPNDSGSSTCRVSRKVEIIANYYNFSHIFVGLFCPEQNSNRSAVCFSYTVAKIMAVWP